MLAGSHTNFSHQIYCCQTCSPPNYSPNCKSIIARTYNAISIERSSCKTIKKPSLDKENLKSYRPVSNLPYLGKIIEKVAISQIDQHLTTNQLHESLQSAYSTNHSTETAIVKVTNDILSALDNG